MHNNPERKVILKADDRGNEIGVLQGIDALIKRGLITDAAVIIQFTGEKERDLLLETITASPLRDKPGVGILLHVNMVTGRPVSNPAHISSLVGSYGVFKRPRATLRLAWKEYAAEIKMDHFHQELDAQIELFHQRFGHYPHALDAHNMNLWFPSQAAEITIETAAQLGIALTSPKVFTSKHTRGPFYEVFEVDQRIRRKIMQRGIPTADHTSTVYWSSSLTQQESVRRLLKALGSLKSGATEFFFHPGHPNYQATDPRYEWGRVRDFMILTDPQVVAKISQIQLTSYKELSSK